MTRTNRWTLLGWSGLVLFLLTWAEMAVPGARRLFAGVLPMQVFACLTAAATFCIAAGVLASKWFLVPGALALASIAALLLSVFAE